MPKIQWEHLPREKWAHLRDRAKERQISQKDLFALAEWKAEDPDVPDDDWYKDFGTFKLCGTGKFPSTFLNGRTGSPRKVSIKALVALASRLTHALRKVARPADHFVSRKGRCGTSQDSEFVRLWKEYGERFSIDFIAKSWRIAFVDPMREVRNQIVHDGGEANPSRVAIMKGRHATCPLSPQGAEGSVFEVRTPIPRPKGKGRCRPPATGDVSRERGAVGHTIGGVTHLQ
jgi:hypothetical protein